MIAAPHALESVAAMIAAEIAPGKGLITPAAMLADTLAVMLTHALAVMLTELPAVVDAVATAEAAVAATDIHNTLREADGWTVAD